MVIVVLSGTQAGGKTTLSKILYEKSKSILFPEVIDDYALSKCYGDMKRHAFNFQIYQMNQEFLKYKNIRLIEKTHPDIIIIADRIYIDSLIYVRALYSYGILTNLEWERLESLYKYYTDCLEQWLHSKEITAPFKNGRMKLADLYIFMHSPVDIIINNLRKRSKVYESDTESIGINKEYLERINGFHNNYMFDLKCSGENIIELYNFTRMDHKDQKKEIDNIIQAISELKENKNINVLRENN